MSLHATESEMQSSISSFGAKDSLETYVTKAMTFISPVTYFLGAGNTDKMEYIPILDTLRELMKKVDVFAQVQNPHNSTDGKIRDICDGTYFRSHPFWQSDENLLQIMLYFDEFTAINQSGCHAARYKFAGVYFQLANLDDHDRSQSNYIQLVIMAKASSIKEHGMQILLTPLVQDLKILEDQGITVERPEGIFRFHGSIVATVSDNLGCHMIGGFSRSFNSLRSCTFCSITKPDLRETHDVSTCERRTVQQYDEQAAIVQREPTLGSTYGITFNSPLNELSHLHAATGLPPDPMHDLFSSGVVEGALQLLIDWYETTGVLSNEYICAKIGAFRFKSSDKSCKPEVSRNGLPLNLKQKAAQVWCILRLFPIIIGHKVRQNDEKWEVLLALKEMVDIIMSHQLSPAGVTYLGDCVVNFHEIFHRNFPDVHMKPKWHYTLHYKDLVREYGMLRNVWTMRFESKHSYFIEIVRRTKNRKNLCKTMAKRHQFMQVTLLESRNYLNHDQFDVVRGKHVPVAGLRNIHGLSEMAGDSVHVFMGTGLKMQGFLYDEECVVIIDFSNDELQFAQVKGCFVLMGIPFLHVVPLHTLELNRHYQAYLLQSQETHGRITTLKNLPDTHPLPLYKLNGRMATVLHHYVDMDWFGSPEWLHGTSLFIKYHLG